MLPTSAAGAALVVPLLVPWEAGRASTNGGGRSLSSLQRSSPSDKTTRSGTALICVAIFFCVLAIYWPVSHFDFVNYDDTDYVRANAHVAKGLTADSIIWAFTSGDAANWFPVTRLSNLIDTQLFGISPGADHLVNVVIGAFAAVFLFLFLERATKCRWPSAAVGFLFALHPLHVESVAWIAERKDVLCAFFFFLTVWLYIRYAERPGAARYALVLVGFALALTSKPMAVTLPLVLVLLDYWPLGRRWNWTEKLPFFSLSAASAVITIAVQQHSGAVKNLSNFPLPLRIENALASYAVYLAQTLWPTRLAVFYPFPADIPLWKPIMGAFLLITGFGFVWKFRHSHRYLLVGWLWFAAMLLPVIGIVQVGAQSHADRYMYLPMAGLLIMVAWGVRDVARRWPRFRTITAYLTGAACASCAVLTARQVQTWRNSGTLFEHALAVTKDNYIAEHNLGNYLLDVPGQLPAAEDHLRRALAINPDSPQARNDLGIALARSGQTAQAASEFQAAVALDPHAEQPRRNLQANAEDNFERGVEAMKAKNTAEAITDFEAALKLKPDYAEAHNDLGIAYASLPNRSSEAIGEFEEAVRLNPDYVDAQYNLGAALSQIPGREREAVAHFKIVQKLHPDAQLEQIIRQLSREYPAH